MGSVFHYAARVWGSLPHCDSIIGENRFLVRTKNIDFVNYRTQQLARCFADPEPPPPPQSQAESTKIAINFKK